VGAAVAEGDAVCVFSSGTDVNVGVETAISDGADVVAGTQDTERATSKTGMMVLMFMDYLVLEGLLNGWCKPQGSGVAVKPHNHQHDAQICSMIQHRAS
jgi:hypothetical protein